MKEHHYDAEIQWTGNRGNGTDHYRNYDRDYKISIAEKQDISGSSDPAFLGNPTLHNPEELLLASLSSCHMLWYLHLCAVDGIVVLGYTDKASGTMTESADSSGEFKEVILRPRIIVSEFHMTERAHALHIKANQFCFIARSVNFPVRHFPEISVAE